MVVYDRESIIKKFHDKDTNASVHAPSKVHQNGLGSHKSHVDDPSNLHANVTRSNSHRFHHCSCFHKCSRQNNRIPVHPLSLTDHASSTAAMSSHHRITAHQGIPARSPASTRSTRLPTTICCRPCTASTKNVNSLSDEISQYRRNYLSHLGAEYQFRTGDSPCYERKTFEQSLVSTPTCRSRSFEQSTTGRTCQLNMEVARRRQWRSSSRANSANQSCCLEQVRSRRLLIELFDEREGEKTLTSQFNQRWNDCYAIFRYTSFRCTWICQDNDRCSKSVSESIASVGHESSSQHCSLARCHTE